MELSERAWLAANRRWFEGVQKHDNVVPGRESRRGLLHEKHFKPLEAINRSCLVAEFFDADDGQREHWDDEGNKSHYTNEGHTLAHCELVFLNVDDARKLFDAIDETVLGAVLQDNLNGLARQMMHTSESGNIELKLSKDPRVVALGVEEQSKLLAMYTTHLARASAKNAALVTIFSPDLNRSRIGAKTQGMLLLDTIAEIVAKLHID